MCHAPFGRITLHPGRITQGVNMASRSMIATSPEFGGHMTRPHRIVLYFNGRMFVVHNMYTDTEGGYDHGNYTNNLQEALSIWSARVQQRAEYTALPTTFEMEF